MLVGRKVLSDRGTRMSEGATEDVDHELEVIPAGKRELRVTAVEVDVRDIGKGCMRVRRTPGLVVGYDQGKG